MITRRVLLAAALAGPAPSRAAPSAAAKARQALADLERRHGGRLGVAILVEDTVVGHRLDERFAMCSTYKALLAAFVLWRAEHGQEDLARRIVYGREVLLPYAPTTSRHVGAPGLSVAELCEAAVTLSDNTAANLLLAACGGPSALTAWLRGTGDGITRLDHEEPALNDVPPGAVHDTTVPRAMAETLRRLLFGNVLSQPSRARLLGWMVACRTGGTRLRAGAPAGWRVGDKTGSFHTTCNDIAALLPPRGSPRVVTAFYVDGGGSDSDRDAVLAAVGRVAARV